MIVRCGRCKAQFEAPGPGRFDCPTCGTVNEVKGGPDTLERPPEPPRVPETPSPRVECEACGFRFIVGDVASAPCPMCGAIVTIDRGSEGT